MNAVICSSARCATSVERSRSTPSPSPSKIRHIDLPAGLPVLRDELVKIRARMRCLVDAGQAQRGWQVGALPTGQNSGRSSLGHGLFRHPVHVVHGHGTLAYRLGGFDVISNTLGVMIASQRIDHRRDHDYTAQGAVHLGRAVGEGQGPRSGNLGGACPAAWPGARRWRCP